MDDQTSKVLLALIAASSLMIQAILKKRKEADMISRPNVHRRSRRKLTAGQQTPLVPVGVTATPSGSDVTLDFDKAVVINGPIPLTVESRTFSSQVVVSPTQAVVTVDGAVAGMDYSLPANAATIRGFNGEGNAAAAGTFPG